LSGSVTSAADGSYSIARVYGRPATMTLTAVKTGWFDSDPVELAILLIGLFELESRIDVPYRVVINEGVNLARRFGAADGHKYINACLDAAARSLRSIETGMQDRG